jgi:hypothetical protein
MKDLSFGVDVEVERTRSVSPAGCVAPCCVFQTPLRPRSRDLLLGLFHILFSQNLVVD